jgi:hypothetical protein
MTSPPQVSAWLRDADPVRPGQLADARRRPDADALLSRILASAPDEERGWIRRRWRNVFLARPGRLRTIAALVAVCVAAVALAVALDGGRPSEAAAARLLNDVARVAAARPARALPPGHYWYWRMVEDDQRSATLRYRGHTFTVNYESVRETWAGGDRSGRILDSVGRVVPASSADRDAWEAAGSPDLGRLIGGSVKSSDVVFASGAFQTIGSDRVADVNGTRIALTSDAAVLEREIRAANATAGAGAGPDEELFVIVGDLLATPGVPPDVRGALFEIAAHVPGGRVVGTVYDRVGRRGTAIRYDRLGEELVIDPQTSLLLARYRATVVGSPTFDYRALFFTPRIVASWTTRPGGASAPLGSCVTTMERFADGSVRGQAARCET